MNNVLCAVRNNFNFKPEDVAERLGISIDEYKKLESGEIQINIERAKRLGEIFNIDPELFLSNDSKIVNYNLGDHSHGNMILHPKQYIDTHKGIPENVFEKLRKERDKLKDEVNTLKTASRVKK